MIPEYMQRYKAGKGLLETVPSFAIEAAASYAVTQLRYLRFPSENNKTVALSWLGFSYRASLPRLISAFVYKCTVLTGMHRNL
eukprot:IDg12288t1